MIETMSADEFANDLAQFLSDEAFDEERVGSQIRRVLIYPDDPATMIIDLQNGQSFKCVVSEMQDYSPRRVRLRGRR